MPRFAVPAALDRAAPRRLNTGEWVTHIEDLNPLPPGVSAAAPWLTKSYPAQVVEPPLEIPEPPAKSDQ